MSMSKSVAHEHLLMAARAGDQTALRELIGLHQPRVHAYVRRNCAVGADADDVVQETLLVASRSLHRYAGRGHWLGWLLGIAQRTCWRMLRRLLPWQSRRQALEDVEAATLIEGEADPAELLQRWDQLERLHMAMRALPQALREVLILRDLEGLPGEQVAETLELSVPAMKTRLHRARAHLRASLRPTGTTERGHGPQ